MKLSDLLKYDHVVVQCHDNPDADAIASGFVLYSYLKKYGKTTELVYSGKYEIQKSNLTLMISELEIPVKHVKTLPKGTELLVMVDCQYDGGNVTELKCENHIDIDHHARKEPVNDGSIIRGDIGSCSTIMWFLLKKGKEESLLQDMKIKTALYYGLYTDTSYFAEMTNPLDKEMKDSLTYDKGLIMKLKNSNMSFEELKIAAVSLLGYEYYSGNRYAILKAEPCDPNILGLISDFVLEVDSVDICIVYTTLKFGIKFSVRSCEKAVNANELAAYLASGIGSGGGRKGKAGGMLDFKLIAQSDEYYRNATEDQRFYLAADILRKRMDCYFHSYDVIYAGKKPYDTSDMDLYEKKEIEVGYVKATDVVKSGTLLTIGMLEGIIDIKIRPDTYIMFGIKGEVYTISEKKFEATYVSTDRKYDFIKESAPDLSDTFSGEKIDFLDKAKVCISSRSYRINACRLERTTKVFTKWDNDAYMLGEAGDMLAVREDDKKDVYVIKKDVFDLTYRKASI